MQRLCFLSECPARCGIHRGLSEYAAAEEGATPASGVGRVHWSLGSFSNSPALVSGGKGQAGLGRFSAGSGDVTVTWLLCDTETQSLQVETLGRNAALVCDVSDTIDLCAFNFVLIHL